MLFLQCPQHYSLQRCKQIAFLSPLCQQPGPSQNNKDRKITVPQKSLTFIIMVCVSSFLVLNRIRHQAPAYFLPQHFSEVQVLQFTQVTEHLEAMGSFEESGVLTHVSPSQESWVRTQSLMRYRMAQLFVHRL